MYEGKYSVCAVLLPAQDINHISQNSCVTYTGNPLDKYFLRNAMTNAIVGLCTIELYLPGMASLKDKRSVLKSMLARMCRTFNVSASEVDHQDVWQSAVVAVAHVSNSTTYTNQVIDKVLKWIENTCPDVQIVNEDIEIL